MRETRRSRSRGTWRQSVGVRLFRFFRLFRSCGLRRMGSPAGALARAAVGSHCISPTPPPPNARFSDDSALNGFRRSLLARRRTARSSHVLSGRRPARPESAAEGRDGHGLVVVRLRANRHAAHPGDQKDVQLRTETSKSSYGTRFSTSDFDLPVPSLSLSRACGSEERPSIHLSAARVRQGARAHCNPMSRASSRAVSFARNAASACRSICRTRSRLTPMRRPISASVCGGRFASP